MDNATTITDDFCRYGSSTEIIEYISNNPNIIFTSSNFFNICHNRMTWQKAYEIYKLMETRGFIPNIGDIWIAKNDDYELLICDMLKNIIKNDKNFTQDVFFKNIPMEYIYDSYIDVMNEKNV